MDYNSQYSKYLALSERALDEVFCKYKNLPQPLASAMRYSIAAGGKRIRPVLLFACCEICGGDRENAAPFAAAAECIHTYSLIHDDLPCMDNDDYRRGKLSCHKVFGEGMAVLAGDALLNLAYEIMLGYIKEHPKAYNIRAAQTIALQAGGLGMAGGQSADLYYEGSLNAGEQELLYIHRHKTGCMIEAAAVAGAHCADADDALIELFRNFSDGLGILFQITDDILDVTGNKDKLGKSIGKDGTCGKLTYPKVYGLEKSIKMAEEKCQEICSVLTPLGDRAEFLRQLSLKILKREK